MVLFVVCCLEILSTCLLKSGTIYVMLKFFLLKEPFTVIQNMSEDVNISLKSMPILSDYLPAMRQYFNKDTHLENIDQKSISHLKNCSNLKQSYHIALLLKKFSNFTVRIFKLQNLSRPELEKNKCRKIEKLHKLPVRLDSFCLRRF